MADGNSSICNFLLYFLFLGLLGVESANERREGDAKDFNVVKTWADSLTKDLVDEVAKFSSFETVKNAYNKGPKDGKLEWEDVDGEQLLATMQKDLQVLVSGKVDALRRSVEKAKDLELNFDYEEVRLHPEEYERVEYLSAKPSMDDDDDDEEDDPFANATYDAALGRKVLPELSAVHIPVEVYSKDEFVLEAINWTTGLDGVWRENKEEDPELAWQYFGSSNGFMRLYPASAWTFPMGDVDLYDCRRRPWYTQGSSSPKDMLILVDTSGSSHGQALELMRIATKTLIDTLGENDFVLLAHFPVKLEDENITDQYSTQETCKKPHEYKKYQDTYEVSCFNTFVQANNRNKKILFEAVDRLTAHGMADFNEAFCWAFDQFEKFRKIKHIGSNCTEMIMVLTDGSTQYPEEVFKTRNQNKQVRVFTYAVGVAATATATVKRMACENKGYFSPIPAMGAINTKVQEYEPVISRPFALNQQEQIHWTSSYVDAPQVGTGMVITATIPVFRQPRKEVDDDGNVKLEMNSSQILGVMGLDVRTEELQKRAPSQKLGPSGYTFAINNNGLVIFHPRLRTEMGYLKDPPNVDLLDVEYENKQMEKIRDDMVDGKTGSKTIRTCTKSMDDKHIECGLRTYYYAPIKGTPLSLGISIPHSAKKVLKVSGKDPMAALEKLEDDIMISGISRIIMAPWEFCAPLDEPTDDAEDDLILAIKSGCNTPLVQHLLYDADMTRAVTDKWGGEKEGIINSFVSTVGGVTRIFPAEDLSMDNMTDTWQEVYFQRAIDTPNSWIFMPEENKANESDPSIMVARAVVLQNEYRPAVAGIHLANSYLREAMVKRTAKDLLSCEDDDHTLCYLLDEGAFVVTSNQPAERTGIFFGRLEPHVMNKLISLNVYRKFEEYDFQGTCIVESKYYSAGPRNFWVPSFVPYDALTLTWWATKAAAVWSQLSFYSWMQAAIGSFGAAEASDDDQETQYRACILKQAQYDFGEKIEADRQIQAEVQICNCTRSFGAARLEGTNMLLVVLESDAFCDESDCEIQPDDLPLQQPLEDSGPNLEDRICLQQTKPRHRRLLKDECISSHPLEKEMNFPCGLAVGLLPSPRLLIVALVVVVVISVIGG